MQIFSALVLVALFSCATSHAAPEVTAPLPGFVDAHGLRIQILEVGFAAPAEKYPDHPDLQKQKRALFFFSVGVRDQNSQPVDYETAKRVRYSGLFPSRGALIDGYAAIQGGSWEPRGQTFWTENIAPSEPFATAKWEVRRADAAPGADGQIASPLRFDGIRVPQTEGESLPHEVSSTTSKNTRVTLQSARRHEGRLELRFEITPDGGVNDYSFTADDVALTRADKTPADKNMSWSPPDQIRTGVWEWTTSINDIGDVKILSFAFNALEFSATWRDATAFERVEIRLPVAALWKTAKPPLIENPPPFAQSNGPIKARIEWRERVPWRSSGGTIWLEAPPLEKHETWHLESASTRDETGKTGELGVYWNRANTPFHSDNSRPARGEIPFEFNFGDTDTAQKLDVTLQIKKVLSFEGINRFDDVPLPAVGEKLEFGADEWEGESLALRRIVRLETKAEVEALVGTRFAVYGGAGLAIVCDFLPTIGTDENVRGAYVSQFLFDGHAPREASRLDGFWEDAGRTGEATPHRLTFLLPLPSPETRTLSVQLETREAKVGALATPIEVRGLIVPPLLKTP